MRISERTKYWGIVVGVPLFLVLVHLPLSALGWCLGVGTAALIGRWQRRRHRRRVARALAEMTQEAQKMGVLE